MKDRSLLRCAWHRLLSAALILWAAAPVAASETPKDRYDMDVVCIAVTSAAAGLPEVYAKERGDAATLKPLYEKRLQASAVAIGRSAAKGALEAEGYRRTILADIQSPDPVKAKREQADLAKQVQRCVALPVFEMFDHAGKR